MNKTYISLQMKGGLDAKKRDRTSEGENCQRKEKEEERGGGR